MKNSLSTALPLLAACLLLYSCGSVKYQELTMLQDMQDDQAKIDSFPVLVIQTDDILSIQVASRKPENVAAFMVQTPKDPGAASGESALGVQEGYRVDEHGKVYLPFIGAVQASGLTIMEFRQEITARLSEFIPDAAVQVRFTSFRVTLLGEVNKPNTYIIPNERLTILEAIGMAGDFTPYARRNSVLLIRQRSDVRTFARINMQDRSLFQSPYFYLSPNDIIYVEPLKAKQYATQGDFVSRYAGVFVPLVGLLTFLMGTAL